MQKRGHAHARRDGACHAPDRGAIGGPAAEIRANCGRGLRKCFQGSTDAVMFGAWSQVLP